MDCLAWLMNNYIVDVWEIRKQIMILTQDLGSTIPFLVFLGICLWLKGRGMSSQVTMC